MEPVKRYDPDVDDTGKACTQENPKGGLVTSTDYDTLLTDHARCVQDARRMANLIIAHLGTDSEYSVTVSMMPTRRAAYLENTEIAERNRLRHAAQRVLETWKEGV